MISNSEIQKAALVYTGKFKQNIYLPKLEKNTIVNNIFISNIRN